MADFESVSLPAAPDVLAPDGSEVRVLLRLSRGSMAHFLLQPGQTSKPVAHRRVEELWYVLSGRGELWRRQGSREEVTDLLPGTCISIPAGTSFQFRCSGQAPLAVVAVTMPPWPGDGEALAVEGLWQPQGGVL